MTDTESRYWSFLECYKGYLPAKEAAAAQQYVVLACKLNSAPKLAEETEKRQKNDLCNKCNINNGSNNANGHLRFDKASDDSSNNGNTSSGNVSSGSSSSSIDERLFRDRWNESTQKVEYNMNEKKYGFFMFRKDDVVAPPLKYTLSFNKVGHCFLACERVDCCCDAPHVKQGAWRLRLDELPLTSMIVNDHGHNRKLSKEDINPTAGYYFALGLKQLHLVQAVVPTFCRFNLTCRHGHSCLYIHASVEARPCVLYKSEIPLRHYDTAINGEVELNSVHQNNKHDNESNERDAFYDCLESIGITTVGDVQVLSVIAFESLASRIPLPWAELFLAATVVRNIDVKSSLEDTLVTFPRIRIPLELPLSLTLVRDLLKLTPIQFYNTNLQPQVMDACEIIRMRFKRDEEYKVITLRKQPPDSFFVRITEFIVKFGPTHAHCSWRKHDPLRPVVTSLITYVDVTQCNCHNELERSFSAYSYGSAQEFKNNDKANRILQKRESVNHVNRENALVHGTEPQNSQLVAVTHSANKEINSPTFINNTTLATTATTAVAITTKSLNNKSLCDSNINFDYIGKAIQEQKPLSENENFGLPHESWCVCPRHWAIAVNYELSTPSGSRCSEQNAMGKLAAIGQPTWSVREVFVHGINCNREVNPLFPCGVCENMLQKVNRDVHSHYGQDVFLYMFDAAMPRKIVYLPIPEISNRDGSSFKRFVASDLRSD